MRVKKLYLLAFLSAFLPGMACAGANGLPVGKHNTRSPIEVTSDALEVMQEQSKATFTGHVVAVQGKVRLKADKMTVYYANAQDKKAAGEKPAGKTRKNGKTPEAAIKKIEAEGSVFLSTPMETASGTRGVYDVEHQEIHLNDNVVLTRGKNVLKGNQLTYSFATARSKLSGGAETADGKKGRVRALFIPENNKNNADPEAGAQPEQ